MNNEQKNRAQILLKDPEIKTMVEKGILAKACELDKINKSISTEQEIEKLYENLSEENIHELIHNEKIMEEKSLLERDIRNMCYELNRSKNRAPNKSRWEEKYIHATEVVNIADVMVYFLGVMNFRRNIKCPFHEDKHPSFKVYPQNNRCVCFSCGFKGSPTNFVMNYKNCSFKESVDFLSNI